MSTRSLRYNTLNRHVPKSRLASTDRDALAFLEAATIYNENQQRAIIELVRRLKAAGLWSKMKAIYPFIGGTAASHKWNLKDPRDVDAAFRLTFTGGWTHSANGADPDGSTGWAETYFSPRSNQTTSSAHVSYYSRTDSSGIEVELGASDYTTSYVNNTVLEISNNIGGTRTTYTRMFDSAYTTATDNDSRAFYIMSRTATNVFRTFRNKVRIGNTANNVENTTQRNLSLGALHQGTSSSIRQFYTTKQCAFSSLGDGLTDAEANALYDIVDLYQKRLGRAV